MKEDILIPKVEEMAVAIVPGEDPEIWDVFLINLKKEPITFVLVNSTGYGEINGEALKTTTLRYFFESIGPQTAVKVEPIESKLFALANEYWVSFVHNQLMYDKKYVFVSDSITTDNLTTVPYLQKKGVMIR
jgi:hypothetical protein